VYDGYDEWDAAAPSAKAPSPKAALPAKEEETRFDGDEGPFTKQEFVDVYDGYDEWDAAAPSAKATAAAPVKASKKAESTPGTAGPPPQVTAPAARPAGLSMMDELRAKQEAKKAAEEAAAAVEAEAAIAAEEVKPAAKQGSVAAATKKVLKPSKDDEDKPKEKYVAPKPKAKPRAVASVLNAAGRAPKAERVVAPSTAPEKKDKPKKPPAFKVNQLVEGRFEGKAKYFPGTVVKVGTACRPYKQRQT
jgi:hypothetical protein